MELRVNACTYRVEIVPLPAGADPDELGWIDGDRICLIREQVVDSARSTLTHEYLYACLIAEGIVIPRDGALREADVEAIGRALSTDVGFDRAAEWLAELRRQYESQGGDAQLAELLGLPFAPRGPARPAIDWNALTPAERRASVIRWSHAGNLTDEQFAIYRTKYEAAKLDPMLGDCAPEPISEKGRVDVHLVTTLKALRRIAARSGMFAGVTDVEWCGDDGVWVKVWTDREKRPFAARVGVRRKDCAEPTYAVAEWDSYAQYSFVGPTAVLKKWWARMPNFMIGKCAESLAFARAFVECQSLIIREEMQEQRERPRRGPAPGSHGELIGAIRAAGAQKPQHHEGVDVAYADDDEPRAATGGRRAELVRHMLESGVPSDSAAQAIIDQVNAQHGDLEDENWELFANKVMEEVARRHRRRR